MQVFREGKAQASAQGRERLGWGAESEGTVRTQ